MTPDERALELLQELTPAGWSAAETETWMGYHLERVANAFRVVEEEAAQAALPPAPGLTTGVVEAAADAEKVFPECDQFPVPAPELWAAMNYSAGKVKRLEAALPHGTLSGFAVESWCLLYGFLAGILWERVRRPESSS